MKLRASVLAAALLAGGMVLCAPAQADNGGVTDFLDTLDSLGIGAIDPGQAVALGQSVCPLLADRAQNTADIAAITKADLAAACEFDREAARANIDSVRPGMRIIETSVKTGAGIAEWLDYLADKRSALEA